MKQLITLFICILILNVANGQPTISPLQTDEYCPGVEYNFTATLTNPYSSMIGEGGCYVTQYPSGSGGFTITFKGKFLDANNTQTFRINHPDNTQTAFVFKKIKSIFVFLPVPLPVG